MYFQSGLTGSLFLNLHASGTQYTSFVLSHGCYNFAQFIECLMNVSPEFPYTGTSSADQYKSTLGSKLKM